MCERPKGTYPIPTQDYETSTLLGLEVTFCVLCANLATEAFTDWAEGRFIPAAQVGAQGCWANDLVVSNDVTRARDDDDEYRKSPKY